MENFNSFMEHLNDAIINDTLENEAIEDQILDNNIDQYELDKIIKEVCNLDYTPTSRTIGKVKSLDY